MVAEIFHIAIFHIEFLWWVKVNNVEIMNAWRIADFWTSIIRQLQIPTQKKEKTNKINKKITFSNPVFYAICMVELRHGASTIWKLPLAG